MPNLEYEAAQIAAGYPCVAGIDEAGRGPLAGPVSAAAVILPSEFSHDLLDDSKKITAKRREPDFCLIDGLAVPKFPITSMGIVKGDGKSLSIAAASIIAKVKRDRLMIEYAETYPEYGFEKHKGYGTKLHMEALREHGPCPIHRKTFAPVAQLLLPIEG